MKVWNFKKSQLFHLLHEGTLRGSVSLKVEQWKYSGHGGTKKWNSGKSMANNVILEGHTWTFWLCQYKSTQADTHTDMGKRTINTLVIFLMTQWRTHIFVKHTLPHWTNLHTLALSVYTASHVSSAGSSAAFNLPAWILCGFRDAKCPSCPSCLRLAKEKINN